MALPLAPHRVHGGRAVAVTVGIDIGTTSVKALAADDDGRVVARARVPHPLRVPAPDLMEHDADKVWRRGPGRALAALGAAGAGAAAVNVVAMVPSLTAVDEKGRPRTPGLLYGDGRGRLSADGELPSFVRWSATQFPDAHGFWPAQAVANHALGGEAVIDDAVGLTTFPLYNGRAWDPVLVDKLGIDVSQLPRVVRNGEPAGKVGDAVLGSGGLDATAEQIVSGAGAPGDVLVLCGTTLIVWAVIEEHRRVRGLYTLADAGGTTTIGGPSNAGGLFLDWASRLARTRLRHGPPAPGRVPVFIPYVRGERVPYNDPDRRAALHDLDLTHDGNAVMRAAYEAAGFVVRHQLDLAELTGSARRIVATGGGTRSDAWMQALADCTGLPVDVAAVPEGAALGAAFLARVAAGFEGAPSDAARWARTGRTVEPDRRWVGPCAERYTRFRQLADG